jgi:hypothetical protein
VEEDDWEKFFELVDKIVDGPGTMKEKTEEVLRKAQEHSCEINFEELVAWFE